MPAVKILVAQGGGPTAVINQSLVGVVLEARKFARCQPRLRRAPRRARHRQRGSRRPDAGDQPQPGDGRRHAVLGAGLDPRQARPQVLPARSSRCCRRTTSAHFFYIGGNDSSDTVRIVSEEAAKAELSAALHPYSQDHRQRPGRQRPHAGLSLGGALRRPGLRRRQSRQRRAARRLCRRGHGPPCRLPDRGRARSARNSPTTART